jgi:hypothetical protein
MVVNYQNAGRCARGNLHEPHIQLRVAAGAA